jgi:hypothetical protein
MGKNVTEEATSLFFLLDNFSTNLMHGKAYGVGQRGGKRREIERCNWGEGRNPSKVVVCTLLLAAVPFSSALCFQSFSTKRFVPYKSLPTKMRYTLALGLRGGGDCVISTDKPCPGHADTSSQMPSYSFPQEETPLTKETSLTEPGASASTTPASTEPAAPDPPASPEPGGGSEVEVHDKHLRMVSELVKMLWSALGGLCLGVVLTLLFSAKCCGISADRGIIVGNEKTKIKRSTTKLQDALYDAVLKLERIYFQMDERGVFSDKKDEEALYSTVLLLESIYFQMVDQDDSSGEERK